MVSNSIFQSVEGDERLGLGDIVLIYDFLCAWFSGFGGVAVDVST
jgi:hypothetical protein